MVIFHSYVSLPKGTSSTLKTSAGRALIPLHPPVDLRPKGRPTEFLTYHSDQPKHSCRSARRTCSRRGTWSLDWFSWENLNRKPWFLPWNIGFSCKFSHHPILWLGQTGAKRDAWDPFFFFSSKPLILELVRKNVQENPQFFSALVKLHSYGNSSFTSSTAQGGGGSFRIGNL